MPSKVWGEITYLFSNFKGIITEVCECISNFSPNSQELHYRVTHICISKVTIIGSNNGLLPGRHQAIIWTNAGILFNGSLRRNFSEILIETSIFSLKKMYSKISSGNLQPFCLGLNMLSTTKPFYQVLLQVKIVTICQSHGSRVQFINHVVNCGTFHGWSHGIISWTHLHLSLLSLHCVSGKFKHLKTIPHTNTVKSLIYDALK